MPSRRRGTNAADAQWFAVDRGRREGRGLRSTTPRSCEAAVQRLRNKVEYTSLPAYLMPPEFTLAGAAAGL